MFMKRFLAGTDGTRDGEHAVRMGESLAQMAGGTLVKLTVAAATPAWEPELERWKEPSVCGGTATGLRGLPGIEIAREAECWRADLVVLGRHDHSPAKPIPLGPTSDTVIRRRGGMTLFVPPQTVTLRRALIALDPSPRGLRVLSPAAQFLNLTGARTFALCVLPGANPDASVGGVWQNPRIEQARGLVDSLQLASGPCDLLVHWGDPVREILDAIRVTQADILVLGVRRGGAAGDLGSGHIGRELLESAACAVLTVPI